jgi:hypothetical protein
MQALKQLAALSFSLIFSGNAFAAAPPTPADPPIPFFSHVFYHPPDLERELTVGDMALCIAAEVEVMKQFKAACTRQGGSVSEKWGIVGGAVDEQGRKYLSCHDEMWCNVHWSKIQDLKEEDARLPVEFDPYLWEIVPAVKNIELKPHDAPAVAPEGEEQDLVQESDAIIEAPAPSEPEDSFLVIER